MPFLAELMFSGWMPPSIYIVLHQIGQEQQETSKTGKRMVYLFWINPVKTHPTILFIGLKLKNTTLLLSEIVMLKPKHIYVHAGEYMAAYVYMHM